MIHRRGLFLVAAAVALLMAPRAQASPELAALYDGRSVGMGGTAVAFMDSGAAVFHNPALMDNFSDFAFTLDVSPLSLQLSSPFPDNPGNPTSTGSFSNDTEVAPLFFIGGGVRVHERVVVGLAAYALSGAGATYDGLSGFGQPESNDHLAMTMMVGELALPVSVRITPRLSAGATLRLAYGSQDADVLGQIGADPVTGAPVFGRIDQTASGFAFPGVKLGLFYRVTDALNLALTYRSRMDIQLDGKLSIQSEAGPVIEGADTSSTFSTPHSVEIGGAYRALDGRLLLALDGRLRLFEDSNESLTTEIEGGMEMVQPFNWRNSYSVHAGGEYLVTPAVPVRVGFAAMRSATPTSTPNPFLPPPGMLYTVTAGAGLVRGTWDVDLAAAYTFGSAEVAPGDVQNGGGIPGDYSASLFMMTLSGTYQR